MAELRQYHDEILNIIHYVLNQALLEHQGCGIEGEPKLASIRPLKANGEQQDSKNDGDDVGPFSDRVKSFSNIFII